MRKKIFVKIKFVMEYLAWVCLTNYLGRKDCHGQFSARSCAQPLSPVPDNWGLQVLLRLLHPVLSELQDGRLLSLKQ